MKKLLIFSLAIATIVSSCNMFGGERVSGNGNVVTEVRDVSGFSAINVSSAIDLYVTQDSGYSVKVVTDENLQQFIATRKNGDLLDIRPEDNMNLNSSKGIKVYVSAPVYNMLGVSGACNIVGESVLRGDGILLELSGASGMELDLDYSGIDVEMSGASHTDLKGRGNELNVEASGSSHVNAMDLTVNKARVNISGASGVKVFVNENLDAEASGASEVVYGGAPKVNSNTSGASNVRAAK